MIFSFQIFKRQWGLYGETTTYLNCKTLAINRLQGFSVLEAGIEPAHPKILDFESSASTSSATRALFWYVSNIFQLFFTRSRFPVFLTNSGLWSSFTNLRKN